MHVAQVVSWGQPPVYTTAPDAPPANPGQLRLKVVAAAVHRLVQARAAGQHFTATTLPLDPSADGIGLDEATGDLYYIPTFAAPTFADYTVVDRARAVPVPKGADPITVAALCNPVMSSWMALRTRTWALPAGFSVLILGATGTSGRAAVTVARALGAGKVIGVARNETALKGIAGLDGYVVQKEPPETSDFASIGHVDVVLDYVYGKATAALLAALKPERETQYVQIGTVGSEETMALPAQVLRAKMLRLTGSAPGSWTMEELGREMPDIVKTASEMERPADVFTKPLSEVEALWGSEDAKRKRMVLVP